MKLFEKAIVRLVGTQIVHRDQLKDFLDFNFPDGYEWRIPISEGREGDLLVETAGRVCYMSFGKPRPGGNKSYIDHILEVGHGSVLEHSVFNFILEGISRSLSHELVRHRMGVAYSQLSQRYVDESIAEYVVPPVVRDLALKNVKGQSLREIWEDDIQKIHKMYLEFGDFLEPLVKEFYPELPKTELRKACRGTARSLLPNATETKIFFTVNVRALRHILEMRGSTMADQEIRELAFQLLEAINSSNCFKDYQVGDQGITTKNRKV